MHSTDYRSTRDLTESIRKDESCVFIKYGDGEYFAATQHPGANCDGTPYSVQLGEGVRESFKFMVDKPGTMFGLWPCPNKIAYWEGIGAGKRAPWVAYHTMIIENFDSDAYLELYRTIKESKRKKVYIANGAMGRAVSLLGLNAHIPVHNSNWFDSAYQEVLEMVMSAAGSLSARADGSDLMFLTSAGMGAKPLLADLYHQYPAAIYLDVGSALDTVCTKHDTRGFAQVYGITYERLLEYLAPIIPPDW
jgi:hypothetical protein